MANSRPHSASNAMRPINARLLRRRRELQDVATLELEACRASQWSGFRPGQFTMLYVPGIGEVPISISGDPVDAACIVHTIRDVGAVSAALLNLKPGDCVGLRGPFGSAWPLQRAEGKDVIIIAGGLGLAPLRPAILQLLQHRAVYGRVLLLYGARSPDDLLFRHQLERWRGRFDMLVEVTVDHAGQNWRGHVGTVNDLIDAADFDPDQSLAMLCGPEVMMRFCSRSLLDCGLSTEQIYLSLERNMQCAIGLCGHCQLGPDFICRDGPVLSLAHLGSRLGRLEL